MTSLMKEKKKKAYLLFKKVLNQHLMVLIYLTTLKMSNIRLSMVPIKLLPV